MSASSSAAASSSSSAAAAAAADEGSSGKVGAVRTLEEVLADPRFKQGVQLTKERKYDEAMEFLGALVELIVKEDETSLAAAAVYFAYGDALLCKVEESADLFGEGVKKAEGADGGEGAEGEDEDDEEDEEEQEGASSAAASASASASSSSAAAAADAEEEEGGEAEAQGQGQGQGEVEAVAISEEVQDDLEVAWENLEAARVIYTKHEGQYEAKRLGEVYLRLGDLQKNNGNYGQAVEDYTASLRIYAAVVDPDSRILADLHYSLAVAHIYASALAPEQAVALKTKGLHHYTQCAHVFEMMLAKAQAKAAAEAAAKGQDDEEEGSGKGKAPAAATNTSTNTSAAEEAKEFGEILQELRETIEATQEEIRQEAAAPGSLSAKAAAPVTTIGFGASSSSAAAASSSAAAAAAAPSTAAASSSSSAPAAPQPAAAAAAAPVNVMAVKKKPKPAPAASAPAAPAAAAAAGKEEEAGANKKRALEQGPATEEGPAEAVVPQPVAKEARVE